MDEAFKRLKEKLDVNVNLESLYIYIYIYIYMYVYIMSFHYVLDWLDSCLIAYHPSWVT